MFHKSEHSGENAATAAALSAPPLTRAQSEFARMLGAVLAEAWAAEPPAARLPALPLNLPITNPKKITGICPRRP